MDKKEHVSKEALKFVQEGNVVGLGSGTTATKFIKLLGQSDLVRKIVGVSTSIPTEMLARESGIKTVDIDSVDWIDITIDGADEVDANFNILKGGGGQLTREKKVRNKSKRYVIIITDDKLVKRVPERRGIPIEVIPFGHMTTLNELEAIGMKCQFREEYITDNGNLVCDCQPLEEFDLAILNQRIKAITGVVETGLFLGGEKTILVSSGENITMLK